MQESFKRAGMGPNGILECKNPSNPNPRTVPASNTGTIDGHPLAIVRVSDDRSTRVGVSRGAGAG
jgi:hypothetical protein